MELKHLRRYESVFVGKISGMESPSLRTLCNSTKTYAMEQTSIKFMGNCPDWESLIKVKVLLYNIPVLHRSLRKPVRTADLLLKLPTGWFTIFVKYLINMYIMQIDEEVLYISDSRVLFNRIDCCNSRLELQTADEINEFANIGTSVLTEKMYQHVLVLTLTSKTPPSVLAYTVSSH